MQPTAPGNKLNLLLLGGSAGSLGIVLEIIAGIKRLPIPVIIILHRKDEQNNLLVQLLSTRTVFAVKEAEDKEDMLPGNIYIAPPGYHLLVEKDQVLSLDLSERVNFSRPSIDVCLETAADAYGPEVAAVLLSGANTDGALGLKKIKEKGGLVIVQDPSTAEVNFMPAHAIHISKPDHIVAAAELPHFLNALLAALPGRD